MDLFGPWKSITERPVDSILFSIRGTIGCIFDLFVTVIFIEVRFVFK